MKEKKEIKWLVNILLVILGTIIVVLSVVVFHQYNHLNKIKAIGDYRNLVNQRLHKGPLTVTDVEMIQSWMTFDYINRIFILPKNYLQKTIPVSDNKYPNVSLNSYAKYQKINIITLLDQVKTAVQSYLTNNGK